MNRSQNAMHYDHLTQSRSLKNTSFGQDLIKKFEIFAEIGSFGRFMKRTETLLFKKLTKSKDCSIEVSLSDEKDLISDETVKQTISISHIDRDNAKKIFEKYLEYPKYFYLSCFCYYIYL